MNVSDFLHQNQFVALFVVLVSVVGVAWKVFYELHVKPRDLRIDFLKEDMARLKTELETVRKLQPKPPPEDAPNKHVDQPPALKAIEQLGSVPRDDAAAPKAKSDQRDAKSDHREEANSDQRADAIPPPLSPLTSLRECYERWKDPSLTKLQKQRFEKDHMGKQVHWNVLVDSVSDASQGRIHVAVGDGEIGGFDKAQAIVFFSEKDEPTLLGLKKGEPVTVEGTLREFFLMPTVEGSALTRRS